MGSKVTRANIDHDEMKSILTKAVKWSAIAVLIGGVFWRSVDYAVLLQFVVAVAAVVVLTQAATMRRYIWMALFLVVAGLFNPVVPVPFSSYSFAIASTFAVFLFFLSLELLKPRPRLSMAAITDRMPGSESR